MNRDPRTKWLNSLTLLSLFILACWGLFGLALGLAAHFLGRGCA